MDVGDGVGSGELQRSTWRRVKKNWSWVKLALEGTEEIELCQRRTLGPGRCQALGGAGHLVVPGPGQCRALGGAGHLVVLSGGQWWMAMVPCRAEMRTKQHGGIVQRHPGARAHALGHHFAPQQ